MTQKEWQFVVIQVETEIISWDIFCVTQASNGQWYQMNDSSVSVSDIRSVLNCSEQAYVLFYVK